MRTRGTQAKACETRDPMLDEIDRIEEALRKAPNDIDLLAERIRLLWGYRLNTEDPEAMARLRSALDALPDGSDIEAGARAYVHLKDGLIREGLAGFTHWLRCEYDAMEDEPIPDDDGRIALLLDRIGYEELRHNLIQIVHKRWPDSATHHFHRGWELMKSGHFDRASEAFATALEKKPEHWPARLGLATVALEEGNWRAAVKQYGLVLKCEVARQIPEIWYDYAMACAGTNDYENEELAYRKAIEIDPHMKYAWNNLGYCLMKKERYAEALPILSEAIAAGTDG